MKISKGSKGKKVGGTITLVGGSTTTGYKVLSESLSEISKEQKEILRLYCEEFLTVKKIASTRQTTVWAVYKTLKKLQKKGQLDRKFMPRIRGVQKTRGGISTEGYNLNKKTCSSDGKMGPLKVGKVLRLHGQVWRVGILEGSERCAGLSGRVRRFPGWSVHVWRDCVMVYSDRDFVGEDVPSVLDLSLKALYGFLEGLEVILGAKFVKPGKEDIRQVKGHYAEVGNELAKDLEERGEKIRLKGDDGREWLVFDNSMKLHEAETTHPQKAGEDMAEVVQPFFKDLRENRPPVQSEVWKVVSNVVGLQYNQAQQMQVLLDLFAPRKSMEKEDSGAREVVRPDYCG